MNEADEPKGNNTGPAAIRVSHVVFAVVLIGLGSMTHAFDANQRHVQLALAGSPTATGATVLGPPDRQTAPPGHYMLFVLNQTHIPSIARIVRLE